MNDDQSLDDVIQKFGRQPLTQSQLDEIVINWSRITQSEIADMVDEVKLLRWLSETLLRVIENPNQQSTEVLKIARFLISARQK
jgi:hypothetical protein